MENVKRRIRFRLCNTEKQVKNLASNPYFLSSTIFNEDLVGIQLARERVVLNKPIYIGNVLYFITTFYLNNNY